MIFLSDLTRTDFSTKIMNPILGSMDDYLYPLNSYVAFNLAKKNYASLKNFSANNPSSLCGVHLYSSKESELSSQEIFIANQWLENHAQNYSYVYLGSRSSLKNLFFSDFIPSAFDALYDYLISNDYFKQIGSGPGSVILFNTTLLFEDFSVPVQQSTDKMQQTFDSFLRNFNSLKNDNEYLYNVILQKNSSIDILTKKIQELERPLYRCNFLDHC